MERVDRDQHTALDVAQLIGAYQELAGLYLLGKQAQVDALNAKNLSLGEVPLDPATGVYGHRDSGDEHGDVSRFIDDLKAGRTPEQPGHLTLPVPRRRRTRTRPLSSPTRSSWRTTRHSRFGL